MEIIKVVEDYITNDKAGGAILINGEWGIGKSFYWRNTLKPHIEALRNSKIEKAYKCLYVSLNGISDTSQIISQVVIAKLPWAKSKMAQIATSLGGAMLNIASNIPIINSQTGQQSTDSLKGFKIEQFLNFNNTVICFDDLERISSKINPAEVLGFINSNFIEINKTKIIIIANEREIHDRENYVRIKEKTISRTLNFDTKLIPLIEIFERYKDDKNFYALLNKKIDFIRAITSRSQERNLRTLLFTLDIIRNTLNSAFKFDKDGNYEESMILFAFLISFEYKAGRINSMDTFDYKDLPSIADDSFLQMVIAQKLYGTPKANAQTESFAMSFFKRYNINSNDYFFFFESLYEYILSGFLNKELLNNDLQKFKSWKEVKDSKQTKPEQFCIWNLQNFYSLNSDKEVDENYSKAISYVQEGRYHFYEYGYLFAVLKSLIDNDMIFESIESIEQILVEGCKKAISNFPIRPDTLFFAKETLSRTEGPTSIKNLIVQEVNRLETEKYQLEIENFFNAFAMDWNSFSKNFYHHFNIFKYLSGKEIYNRISGFDLKSLRILVLYFQEYLKLNISAKENHFLNVIELKELVENGMENKNSRLEKHVYSNLVRLLQLILESYTSSI